MVRSSNTHLVAETESVDFPSLNPKQPYMAAVRDMSSRLAGIEALYDTFGRVRTLCTSNASGLFSVPFAGDAAAYARQFIGDDDVVKALGLQHAELVPADPVAIPGLGQVVRFAQTVTIGSETLRVRGGTVHAFFDASGHIFQVNNTVRHGRKPASLDNLISQEAALEAARDAIDVTSCLTERAELVLSAHNDRLDPVWEVVLTTNEPRRVVLVLVKASSGKVVCVRNLLRTNKHGKKGKKGNMGRKNIGVFGARKRRPRPPVPVPVVVNGPAGPVLARAFLCIPDPNVAISKQVHDAVLESLHDKKVLKNDNLIAYIGSGRREVRAKADGTFMYKPGDAEFSAVATFFAFHFQMELLKSWGMRAPEKPIPVFVDDPSVRDNAYFDPEAYEIHLGVGSGSGGLAKNIAWDLGVTWHENGHHVVYLQTPGKDLPGSEGGGIHESIGDVLGDLLMDFWFRLKFADKIGTPLTVADVENDRRVIGKYALPPDGIRIQKNKARTPQDKTGEPHDDGLISGGAKADLMVGMVKQTNDVEKGLTDFGKLTLAALALVPSHKVTFVDLLRAYLTADQQLFAGAYKALVTKSFADHGIVIKGSRGRTTGGAPVIIIK